MEIETIAIIIQPAPDTSYGEAGFAARIENGRLLSVQGMGGITQPEDVVGILHEDDQSIRWQSFLWSHYAALYLLLEYTDEARLVIEGGGEQRICDIDAGPVRVSTGGNGAIIAARYEPVVEGEFVISPDMVCVGETHEFVIDFIVGASGIDTGGGVRIQTPFSSWSFPSLFDGAVSVRSLGNAEIERILSPQFHPIGVFGYVYWVKVVKGRLEPGDSIRIRYSNGSDGIRVQTYPKDSAFFPAYLDARGTGIYYPFAFADVAAVYVEPGPPEKLRLAVPMVIGVGELFDAKVIALDDHYNPVYESFSGSIGLRSDDGLIDISGTVDADEAGLVVFKDLRIDEPGMHILTVSGDLLKPASLVVKCAEGESPQKLFWGAIHGHTGLSDGEGDPEEYYPYGREIGLLDFCAMADHDWELAEHERSRLVGGFRYVQDVADEFNDPGHFVTIAGYEWMGNEGHANVYYNNEEFDNPMYVGNISVVGRAGTVTFAELLAHYKGRSDVMIIPHTSHGFRWTEYDPELTPALEIYSCWGPSEFRVNPAVEGAQDGLQKGFRLGFIGGADSHHSSPGQTGKPSKYHILGCREGFAAVYASELTRDGIFGAIRAKNCYATTAERILLEFSVNGTSMGSSTSCQLGDALSFEGIAGGTAEIRVIELICNGEVIHSIECGSQIAEFRYQTSVPDAGSAYYYLRVTQADDERAWSSPIWVDVSI